MSADPRGPSAPPGRGGVTVAFCPAAPVLLPAVEIGAGSETTELRRTCHAAVAAMLASDPRTVVVVAPGVPWGAHYGPGDVASLRGFGLDAEVPFAGEPAAGRASAPPVLALGAWLLDEAAFPGERVGVGPEGLGRVLAESSGPVGVLALGDGSARRGIKAPGYLHEAAAPFDAQVVRALAEGDAGALAALDPAEGERLLAAGVAVWRAVGAALTGRAVTGRLHADVAPFGVGYLVADWTAA